MSDVYKLTQKSVWTNDVGEADWGDGAEGEGAAARPRPGAQEVEEGEAMRLFEKLWRMIVENRRVRIKETELLND